MNSLPLIPHHLFIAAIGNQRREGQKSTRPEPRFVEMVGSAASVAVEPVENRRPSSIRVSHPLRVSGNLVTT